MSELKKKLAVMPMHAIVMSLCSLLSIVGMFVPMFELYVQYVPRVNYSLFSVLINPRLTVQLRESVVSLDFLGFAAWMFVATIIVSVAAFSMSLSYGLFVDTPSKRRISCISVLVLFVIRVVLHMLTLAKFISEDMMLNNNMTQERLYVAQTLMGNALFVVIFIGAVASLYGAIGLKMNMKLLSYPYILWVVVFTILPLILIVFRAFFADINGSYQFTLDGFSTLFADKNVTTSFYGFKVTLQEYFSIFLRSLDYAVWTTIGCLLISYPLAYILAGRTKRLSKNSSFLLMLFVLPMWINTMLRTYAWRAFFGQTGVLNTFLLDLGWIESPILFLKNEIMSDVVTKLVMVNDFLPFMLLPIYSILVKLDDNLLQASHDLGANTLQTFCKVTFPLSLPGVISGIQMVFMPSLTFYMIPDIISEGSKTTIGNSVQNFILNESSTYQQAGNVLSLLLLIFVLITMGILRNQDKESAGGGMAL